MLRGFSALEERNPVLLSLSSEPGVLSLALRHAPWTHPQWTHPQPRSIWPGSHRDRQVTGVTPYLTFFESGTRPQNHPPSQCSPQNLLWYCGTKAVSGRLGPQNTESCRIYPTLFLPPRRPTSQPPTQPPLRLLPGLIPAQTGCGAPTFFCESSSGSTSGSF